MKIGIDIPDFICYTLTVKRKGKVNEMRKDNTEIKEMILTRLAEIEYTHTYIFAIDDGAIIRGAIVENADDILPLITVAERQAKSHGSVWGVRMRPAQISYDIIRKHATEIFDVCSKDYMENEFKTNGNGGSNNRGHIFERLCAEVLGGVQNTKKNAKCTESGDINVNGKHYQVKFWNATVTTETTVNNLYAEYMKKCA